jgi:hypothetical protein
VNTTIAIMLAWVLNVGVCITLAIWYAVPWLKKRSRGGAFTALLLVHLGRTLSLQAYSSQQAGMVMPNSMRDHVVVGDLAGWALALIILVCLRYRARFATFLIWLIVVETIVDIGSGTLEAIRANTMGLVYGTTWLIVAFYVPVMMVALGLTVWQLLSRRGQPL